MVNKGNPPHDRDVRKRTDGERYSIDWPPGFVSQIVVDRKTGKFETPFAAAQRNRRNGGWDQHTITQPGSVEYVARGPVGMMERTK